MANNPLPKTIRVGYRHYNVVEWDLADASGEEKFGDCGHALARIRISNGLDPEQEANTLFHELLHACYKQQGLSDGAGEEDVVVCLANVLAQVWQDNPKLIAYFDKAFKGK